MRKWRIIYSGHADPYSNMAVDEAILKAYSLNAAPPTLRIYGWKPHGVTIGYAQHLEDVLNIKTCMDNKIIFLKRMTGGEAVYHGDELTYSLACSRNDLKFPHSVKESYKYLSAFLINMYKVLGLEAKYFDECQDPGLKKASSFCFSSSQEFDICVNGRKIGGNAQRRGKNIIFQHGSVPIDMDISKIKNYFREDIEAASKNAVSLKDLLNKVVDFHELAFILEDSFKRTFNIDLVNTGLTQFEKDMAEVFMREKIYGKDSDPQNQ